MKSKLLKQKVVALREEGNTYGEINKILGMQLRKSTLSCWCRGVLLTEKQKERINSVIFKNLKEMIKKAAMVNEIKRESRLKSIFERNKHLASHIQTTDSAKIALAMLYACEGAKCRKGSLMFGNSDPIMVDLFLTLLRRCYKIDENKFRCTLQGRADQDISKLEKFWSDVTKIPLKQFYKARIDKRSIGKPTKKSEYKGVCRIDYYSADIYEELKQMFHIICSGVKRAFSSAG